jgi:hypothetical protein
VTSKNSKPWIAYDRKNRAAKEFGLTKGPCIHCMILEVEVSMVDIYSGYLLLIKFRSSVEVAMRIKGVVIDVSKRILLPTAEAL